jgi:DNA polymerase-3 subunit gamma/tau
MPLHLDHRPKTLKKVVGQDATVAALKAVLERDDIPHAFLFHGPSGCGKTTLARIVAKKLGCSEMDLKELNVADVRGIDSIREITRNMTLRPMGGTARVWILDEAHQLSKDAQNALLKPLEDCPEHVYFMLCTTDPQKLIATIKNRCSQFALTLVSDEELTALLEAVASKEGVEIPESVINSIVAASAGSPRSALVHLDKVKDLPDDEMEKAVSRIDVNNSAAIDLCRVLLKDKPSWPEIAKVLSSLSGGEPEQIRMNVLGYCNAILLKGKFNGRACLVMECFKDPFYNDGKFRLTLACASSVA